jgi:hypothetical protein
MNNLCTCATAYLNTNINLCRRHCFYKPKKINLIFLMHVFRVVTKSVRFWFSSMHLLSDQLIYNIQLMNFRTYLEFDKHHKRFSAELINLFITIYIISHVFLYCLVNNLSWISTISLVGFLTIYFYTQFIRLISIVPNVIMSTISLIILSKSISHRYLINKSLFIITSMIYLVVLYPLFYLLLRRLPIKLSHTIGLKLEFIRERIDRQCLPSFFQYHSSNKLYQLIIILFKFFVLLFLVLFF